MRIVLKIGIFFLLSHNICIMATLGVTNAQGNAVQLQNDNKIIVAGTVTVNNLQQLMLARYTPFGTIDTAYGYNGYVATPLGTDAIINALTMNSGQAVVAGLAQLSAGTTFALAQYNKNGDLDLAFNGSGIVTQYIGTGACAHAIMVDSSNRYVAAGTSIIGGAPIVTVVRYKADGTLDASFGESGIATKRIFGNAGAYDFAFQNTGKIITVGYTVNAGTREFGLVRFNTDGSLDTTFGSVGTIVTPIGSDACAYAIAVQSNNYIIAAGVSNAKFALARYKANGSLDTTFGFGGIVTTAIGSSAQINDIVLQSDGKIVAVGFSQNDIALARYTRNGSLDTTFGSGGIVITEAGTTALANSVSLQSNGQIIVSGSSNNGTVVLRYNTNGSLDTTFGVNGVINFPNDYNAPDIFGIADVNIAADANIAYAKLNLNNSIINSDINAAAAIADAKLQTIQTPGKVLNSATTATALNSSGAIVARDTLGNFSAQVISADLLGNVIGSATQNLLKSGDTMSGSLVLPSGTFAQPALQFDGSLTTGLSADAGTLSISTQGIERVAIDSNGALLINTPTAGTALTINGGGALIKGDILGSGNIVFNTSSLDLNSVGSTQGPFVKIFSGVANTGLRGQVSIDYSAAGFSNPPVICANSISGTSVTLSINLITNQSATIMSPANFNVPFNYIALGI